MITPDRARPQRATEGIPLANTSIQSKQSLPRGRLNAQSTHITCQKSSSSCPRIPRLVSRYSKGATLALDSQLQHNASHVQKSKRLLHEVVYLIVPNEGMEKSRPVPAARHSPLSRNERPSEMESSSNSEQRESSGGTYMYPRHEKSRRPGHRDEPRTDSDDDDPFHFDSILSSHPTNKEEDDSPSRTLSSSLLRRASIVPVDPTATPAPHRFSLLRERGSEDTIFVQEICDSEGRRWSLRVPASGLPEDMVQMLEELEKLAVELGRALPRIVVTCSAESLSLKRRERKVSFNHSSGLLLPPPAMGDESLMAYDTGTRRSLAQEKRRLEEPSHSSQPTEPSDPSSAVVSSDSDPSLTCIYLPELAPEFLPGSSTSPVLQPADGFHSRPAQAIRCPRQRQFFSAFNEPQPASGIAKRLVLHSTRTESVHGTAAEGRPFFPASPSAKSKSRMAQAKSKSVLPILKANSKSPPRLEGPGGGSATGVQVQPSPSGHGPRIQNHDGRGRSSIVRRGVGVRVRTIEGNPQQPVALEVSQSLSQSPDRSAPQAAPDALRAMSAPALPTGRKLRHLFRRPPVRSASHPPLYSHPARPVMDSGMRRPASGVVPVAPEVGERRMPRLPSTRNLLRKLT